MRRIIVTYGVHSFPFDADGLAVDEVQVAVQDITNAPDDAEAYLDGVLLNDKSVLVGNAQALDFMKAHGRKGSGSYWTEEEFVRFTGISSARLAQLEELGLRLAEVDGKRLLSDDDAARWNRFLLEQATRPWLHSLDENPPVEFSFGPLLGTLSELATWISAKSTKKSDALINAARREVVWVRRIKYRCCEVWFRHEGRFNLAVKSQSEVSAISRRKPQVP